MFTDWTSSIFEESKLSPVEWLLVIGLWQLKLNATEIADAAAINERTAQRCLNLLDGGIYETYLSVFSASWRPRASRPTIRCIQRIVETTVRCEGERIVLAQARQICLVGNRVL